MCFILFLLRFLSYPYRGKILLHSFARSLIFALPFPYHRAIHLAYICSHFYFISVHMVNRERDMNVYVSIIITIIIIIHFPYDVRFSIFHFVEERKELCFFYDVNFSRLISNSYSLYSLKCHIKHREMRNFRRSLHAICFVFKVLLYDFYENISTR
jgi:hypothetical protein